jgi:hypothetical protein
MMDDRDVVNALRHWDRPAIVREDEQAKYQRLVTQGKEAAALEDEGKHANVAWVQALKEAYPDAPNAHNRVCTNPRVYAAVAEARGCTFRGAQVFVSTYRDEQTRGKYQRMKNEFNGTTRSNNRIRRAVVELTTKYRLGADPQQCMDALVHFLEEQTRGQ